jgi:hypothetical protein
MTFLQDVEPRILTGDIERTNERTDPTRSGEGGLHWCTKREGIMPDEDDDDDMKEQPCSGWLHVLSNRSTQTFTIVKNPVGQCQECC